MNNRLFQVLSIRPFLFLWLAEVFSQIAMNMVNFVLIIVAYKISNSNAAVSGIVLSFTVPAILFGLIAGVYVDHWDKKKVLFATNALRTLLLVVLAIFHVNIFSIYALSFAIAVVTQFFIPAETPMIPRLVKKELLFTANALFGMGLYGSLVIAYALSGAALLLFGDTYVFFFLAVLFFLSAFCITLIKVPEEYEKVIEQKTMHTFMRDVKNVFLLVVKTREIFHSLLLLTLSQLLILIMAVIGPGFANKILGIQVDAFPLLFVTPAALGMVVGALILGNYFHGFSKEKSATIGVFLSGVAMLFLPFGSRVASRGFIQTINTVLPPFLAIDILHIMIVLAFIMGFANAFVFVPSNTLIQEKTSDEFRGRVYGMLNALVGIFSLLPIIIVGEFADIFGVSQVIIGIGITIIIIGIFRVIFANKIKSL